MKADTSLHLFPCLIRSISDRLSSAPNLAGQRAPPAPTPSCLQLNDSADRVRLGCKSSSLSDHQYYSYDEPVHDPAPSYYMSGLQTGLPHPYLLVECTSPPTAPPVSHGQNNSALPNFTLAPCYNSRQRSGCTCGYVFRLSLCPSVRKRWTFRIATLGTLLPGPLDASTGRDKSPIASGRPKLDILSWLYHNLNQSSSPIPCGLYSQPRSDSVRPNPTRRQLSQNA